MLVGDSSKARNALGWGAQGPPEDRLMMVDFDDAEQRVLAGR